jgi:5-methylcytosine-specific restriction protein A
MTKYPESRGRASVKMHTPCNEPGCPRPAERRGRCLPHARALERSRGSAAQQGYDARHRAWRRVVLARDRVCRICGVAPARIADHITPIAQGSSRFDYANGQGLCDHCHNIKRATSDKHG